MLDLKFIKENIDAVKENIRNRNVQADADKVVELYDARNKALQELEELRRQRNENAKKMKGKLEQDVRQALIEEGKSIKEQIAAKEASSEEIFSSLNEQASLIPNMAHPDAPVGKEDKDNTEIRRIGTIPQFSFKAKDHVELGEALKLIDFETATRVSGSKFYYLTNEAVILELALTRYALDILQKHGFMMTLTPDIAREEIVEGIGFNPRGEESNIYTIEGTGTCLVGTAEITLGGYHAGQIIDLSNGPILMAGVSHCFRREAGSAGQYSKGLYRVHQFSKIEMFVYCKADESDALHEKLREIEEEIFSSLDIPFRVVDTCTGDLGGPAYRKYDLEAWMPGRGEEGDWGEITSTSNCTDYQSRRLGIRYKDEKGNNVHAHTLNGTAIAISRAIISIMENFQQEDGSIRIPEALVPYTGFSEIRR
ncbi:serine--tRNA ligase [Spirochaeta isovalerica]|uniref:Serine--tRNA ligase n=1 Tax=Spirochaeta isovalerica TaxID=150 RepID=A0A841RCV2_9SPIO|nr:serine--tRNA ligase [Spirochaeta isovalerica]MBB6481067.1 seryl-tRNA synthetase [Spirochaeta isovalerica]